MACHFSVSLLQMTVNYIEKERGKQKPTREIKKTHTIYQTTQNIQSSFFSGSWRGPSDMIDENHLVYAIFAFRSNHQSKISISPFKMAWIPVSMQ